ncbi:DUF3822 family protein [Flavobacteriaceae bacterium Ap0902]|nr:DUF3822 family protein [Flavobacteriaceae bacterium Ap0902]
MTSNYMSILLEKGGLSFLVTKNKDIIENEFIAFDSNLNLADNLNQIYDQNLYLKQSYDQVRITYLAEKFILVPKPYFEEDHDSEKWLGFNTEIDEEDLILEEELHRSYNAMLLCVVPERLMDFTKSKFNTAEIRHAGIFFLNYIHDVGEKEQVFLNVHQKQFEIVVFKNQAFNLYNIFEYQTKEDIIYHLLNIMKQLKIDPNTVELYYFGITDDSATLKMMMNFIRHVIPATDDLERMQYFTLIENLQPIL